MGIKERTLITKRLARVTTDERLFRINAGIGWTGRIVEHSDEFIRLKFPRPFHGAPTGFPDLIGWKTVEITPEMIGQKIAVFQAVEVKATGDLSDEQRKFRDVLTSMGGEFRVMR
jgi:hypothetical protein